MATQPVEVIPTTPPADWREQSTVGRARDTTVGEVMTRDVTCVTQEVSVESLATVLLERNMGGAPVVDEHDRLIGMVSRTDLLQRRHDDGNTEEYPTDALEQGFHLERLCAGTVRDVMTPYAVSLPPDAPISRAAALMSYEGIHRIPVLSDQRVIGLLTPLDVLRWIGRISGYVIPDRRVKSR